MYNSLSAGCRAWIGRRSLTIDIDR